jgi:hypothetical protein
MIKAGDLIENNYLIGARISKGTFGELFIGRNIETGEKYAVKVQYGEIGAGLKVRSPSLSLSPAPFSCSHFLSSGRGQS